MTMTNLSIYLYFGPCIMIYMMNCILFASIKIPSKEEIIEFKGAINKISNLQKCLGYNGWVETLLAKSPVNSIQEMFYNGWKSNDNLKNMFVFDPDGTILLPFLMFLVVCMIVRFLNGKEYMKILNLCANLMVGFMLLTPHLKKLTDIFNQIISRTLMFLLQQD